MHNIKRLLTAACMTLGVVQAMPILAQTSEPSAVPSAPVVIRTPPPVPAPPVPATPASLRGTKILFYDFLDVREAEFTPAVLTEMESQLIGELGQNQVSAELIRFKDTPTGLSFANAMGGAMIPVGEVISSQKAREAEAGIRYRLIAFPADFQSIGAWRHYAIRWLVIDAATNQIVLRSEYAGKHMVMWKNSENAAARAKKLVGHIMMAMLSQSLI